MKVSELKSMLTGFTTGGNNFEVKFVCVNNVASQSCEFAGMSVYPDSKVVIINIKQEIEAKKMDEN